MRRIAIALLAAWPFPAEAQPTAATRADSGWVALCNGRDFTGLYVFQSGRGVARPDTQSDFSVGEGIIRVQGKPGGYLGTLRRYSHYRVRVEYRWPAGAAANANSGLLIHLDSAAVFSGAYASGGRPRSIEVNCRRDNGFPWSLWSARGLGPYITTSVDAIPAADEAGRYRAGGAAWTDDPWNGGNGRVITGDLLPNPELPPGQWNRGEAHVRGDSGTFILNGQVRTRGWDFRDRAVPGSAQPRVACDRGNIGLQSEGHAIDFRGFEVMELDPASGRPLHARRGCTDRGAADYDARAVVDDGSCGSVSRIVGTRAPAGSRAPTLRFPSRDADKVTALHGAGGVFDLSGRAGKEIP